MKDEYKVNFYIQNQFTYEWHSEYFDFEVISNEANEFGSIPFSLETFLQIYRNPKNWDIILRPKNDDIDMKTVSNRIIGKLIIKSHFEENPFIVPIQCTTQNLQTDKNFKVITESIEGEEVISSADLLEEL